MNSVTNLNEIDEVSSAVEKASNPEKLLKYQQETYIDYIAMSGVITRETGEIQRMTVNEFAAEVGVSVQTLYNWRKSIPAFWDRVNKRRKQLGSQVRLQRVWAALYMRAASGNPQAAAMFLANHDPEFKMPMQKVEHEAGNSWAALARAKPNIIEAEATNEPTEPQPR